MSTLLLKNGTLLDKSENLVYAKKDILIIDNRIKKIADTIVSNNAQVIDCTGKLISAGFIDVHTHVFPGCPGLGISADQVGVEQGVTTVFDAGTAGPENFEQFIEEVVKPSKTRVFSEMNYSKMGLWIKPEGNDESKWDLDLAENCYHKHEDIIVAIKARASNSCVGKLGIKPIQAAKELATRCNIPLYVHIGHALPLIEDTLAVMQKGDIITHAFHGKDNNLLDLENKTIKPETQAARDRGVKFDVGHGAESFCFSTLATAMELGFYPDCLSTDLHSHSFNNPVKSLAETMDKMIALGIPLEDTVSLITSAPAELFNLKQLGKLKEGYLADITVFHTEEKETLYKDSEKNELIGHLNVCPDIAIVDGVVQMNKMTSSNLALVKQLEPKLVNTDPQYIDCAEAHLINILDYLETQGIRYDENTVIGLGSHIFGLVTRVKKHEEMIDLGDDLMDQIDKKAYELAQSVTKMIEEKEKVKLVKSETFLIAVHIQSAM